MGGSRRQQRSTGVEAFVSRMAVDKYVYLSKNRTSTVEVWDKRSEKLVDCVDCAQIVRYTSLKLTFDLFEEPDPLNLQSGVSPLPLLLQAPVRSQDQTGRPGGAAVQRGQPVLGSREGPAGAERCSAVGRH